MAVPGPSRTEATDPIRIAMVAYGDISHDSRVQREAVTLAAVGHLVTVFCLAADPGAVAGLDRRVNIVIQPAAEGGVIPGSSSPFRRPRRGSRAVHLIDRARWLWSYAATLRTWGRAVVESERNVDVWHAHDFAGLMAVGGSKRGDTPLVYDVHDLVLESGIGAMLPRIGRWFLRRYERRLVRRSDLVIAVNEALAAVVARRYQPKTVVAVHNCVPTWTPTEPHGDLIRKSAGIRPDAPVILYHGILGPTRGIESLCEALLRPGLETAHLALLGYGVVRERYVALAADPRFGGRVHVLDPVPPRELLPWVASADVGAMVFPRATLNLYLSTPNKLFECLAAGVPVVVSDFPAMRRIVMDDPLGPLGATCDPSSIDDIARALVAVLGGSATTRDEIGRRCAQAARDRWNWEAEAQTLISSYGRLLAQRAAPSVEAGGG
jgi:glycosyltransferase involved in cell wall biosynthesis